MISFALNDCFDTDLKEIEFLKICFAISIFIGSTPGNIIEWIVLFRILDDIMLNTAIGVRTRHTKSQNKVINQSSV